MLGVTILGNNSALPAHGRHPTAQVVTLADQLLLLDCGEGTQLQLTLYKIKRSRINHIYISHLHGDHYFGLIGLLTSMALLGRTADLHLYAPAMLSQILDLQFTASGSVLSYKLHFHSLHEGIITDEDKFSVEAFPVYHRIECWGFIVREKKKPRSINIEAVEAHNIPRSYYDALRNGADYMDGENKLIHNAELTVPNHPPLSYAYSADTMYNERIAEKVKHVTVLYHEATYLQKAADRAALYFHSTTAQAATIAKIAGVHRLLIGHFSSKYDALEEFCDEAGKIFSNTSLALEGVTYLIK